MKIFRTRLYKTQLVNILEFIVKDKISGSEKFYNELDLQIENLIHSPLKCRQSFYSDDENVRDMIFKKYTIQFKIYENKISILKIFNKISLLNYPDITKYIYHLNLKTTILIPTSNYL